MKKLIIVLSLVSIMASCKKDPVQPIKPTIKTDSVYYNTKRHLTLIMTGSFQNYTIVNSYHKINIDNHLTYSGSLIIELDTYNGSTINVTSYKNSNEKVNVSIKDKDTNTEIVRNGNGKVSLEYQVK